MKRFIVTTASLLAFAIIHTAYAAPPHGKSNILHCGCVVDAEGALMMAYVDVNVSSKAKGHTKHGAGTIDSCFDGVDTYIDFERTTGDCRIGGTPLPGLAACETEEAGQICGIQAPQ